MTATTLNGNRPALHADTPQPPPPPATLPTAQAAPARRARHATADDQTKRWKRLRWGVRIALVVGVAASVAANMLHARPNPISQAIAAWPPLALLLTVELISRVPVYRRSLAAVRLLATTVIAGIAAWVSYWHMTAVAARYGETGTSPYLLPLSVDGLIVVASICLVELSGHIDANDRTPPASPPAANAPRTDTPEQPTDEIPTPTATPSAQPRTAAAALDDPNPATNEPTMDENSAAYAVPPDATSEQAPHAPSMPTNEPADDDATIAPEEAVIAPREASPAAGVTTGDPAADSPTDARCDPPDPSPQDDPDRDVVPTETGAAVSYWLRRDPNMHPDDIAARVGKSSRQVRRYMAASAASGDRRRTNGERRRLPTDT